MASGPEGVADDASCKDACFSFQESCPRLVEALEAEDKEEDACEVSERRPEEMLGLR